MKIKTSENFNIRKKKFFAFDRIKFKLLDMGEDMKSEMSCGDLIISWCRVSVVFIYGSIKQFRE